MSRGHPWRPPTPRAPRGPRAGAPRPGGPPAGTTGGQRAPGRTGRPGGRPARPLPVPVTGSRTLELPLRLLIALDESGSLASSDPNQQGREAVLAVSDWLAEHSGDPRDRIGLVRFADRAATIAPVRARAARGVFEQELRTGTNVGGGTRLTPAIDELCAATGGRGRARRVSVLITDGQVAESADELQSLFTRLNQVSDAVHLVALDHDHGWTRYTHVRYANLPLTGTAVLHAFSGGHLAYALAATVLSETGLRPRRRWSRRA